MIPALLSSCSKPALPCNIGAETLADPYKGKTPLARVNAFQEPFAVGVT